MLTTTNIKDLLGKTHTIKLCLYGDISNHFEKIQKYIPKKEEKDFCKRMAECIDVGTAFSIEDKCFLYYKNYNKTCATGIALFGENSPLKIITLFAGIFSHIDKDTFKIDFHLHSGKFAKEYKSLLTITSIKRNHQKKSPLIVRVDKIQDKIKKIYSHRGIPWEL